MIQNGKYIKKNTLKNIKNIINKIMSQIIYSNNEISRKISDIVFNILSLVILIYFSRSLLYNPISYCFLFYFIFSFILIGFFTSLYISKFDEIHQTNEEEPIIIEPKKKNNKYKLLLQKFKNLRKEFRQTKNEINDIKKELLVSKQYETISNNIDLESEISSNQEFVDNIRDIPDEIILDDEILDDIINQTETHFEIIN